MAKKKEQPKPALTAAIYARYSSNAQNDASIEQQIAECEQYARQNGLKVVTTFEDRAISGRSDKRPGFQKMIRAAERREFQVLLTYKSNRIARNMYDALRYETRLEDAGVKVVYCKENFGDNAAGRMMLRMMMSINEFYSDNMAEDIRRGLMDSASQGKVVGALPYGYKKGEDGKVAIDEELGPIVQEIFSRVMNDETYADIARDLNARGYRTQHGKQFGKSSFRAILENERYTGVYLYGDIRIDGGMPKLIEKEVYDAVNHIVKHRQTLHARQRENGEYLLTGKIFCGKCLGPMVGISGKGRWGKDFFYYSCNTKRLQKACDKKNERRDWIEEEVTRAVQSCVLDDDTVEWIANTAMEMSREMEEQSQLGYYESRLKEAKKQITNILRAVEMGIISDEFKERLTELRLEKQDLEGLIAVEKMGILTVDRDQVIKYLLMIRTEDYKDKKFQKRIIRDFVKAVYVYDDHFKLVVDFTGESKTYTWPLKKGSAKSGETTDCSGVCISSNVAHHTTLIQTPDPRNCIDVSDAGFVITWYFCEKTVKP